MESDLSAVSKRSVWSLLAFWPFGLPTVDFQLPFWAHSRAVHLGGKRCSPASPHETARQRQEAQQSAQTTTRQSSPPSSLIETEQRKQLRVLEKHLEDRVEEETRKEAD